MNRERRPKSESLSYGNYKEMQIGSVFGLNDLRLMELYAMKRE